MPQTIEISFAKNSAPRLLCGALLGAFIVAAGCGAEPAATYRDYALRTAQANCQRQFRCCGSACSTTADATFNRQIENTQYAIDAGLAIFSPAQGQACLEANNLLYTDCNQYVDLVDSSRISEACTGVLEGTLPLGAACTVGTQDFCKPTTYCALDTSFTPAQARCRRTANVGESCDLGVRCVTGSTCSPVMPRLCVGNPPVAHFQEPCGATMGCAGSLVCLPVGTCGLPQEGGQACMSDTQCLSNRCAVDTCTLSMTKPQTVADFICP